MKKIDVSKLTEGEKEMLKIAVAEYQMKNKPIVVGRKLSDLRMIKTKE